MKKITEPPSSAKTAKPPVRMPAVEPPRGRLGFLKGQMEVPDDFDRMGAREIAELMEGNAAVPTADQRKR